ncbi:MAG: DUF6529 family protein, partial [Dermatophilaceae bacterium]
MTTVQRSERALRVTLGAVASGAALALALGVYGSSHQPSGQAISTFGFGSMIAMKVWLGVVAGLLALTQLI